VQKEDEVQKVTEESERGTGGKRGQWRTAEKRESNRRKQEF